MDWSPLGAEDWAELRQGDRLRDRSGREWTARSDAYEEGRDVKVVLASGDLVRIETHWHASDYELVEGGPARG